MRPLPLTARKTLQSVTLRDSGQTLAQVQYWAQERIDRLTFVAGLLGRLDRQGWPNRADIGWSDYDVEIYDTRWSKLQLTTVAEDHPGGKQLIRCRLRPRWSLKAKLGFWLLCGLELVVLGFVASWQPWLWLLLLTLPLFAAFLHREGRDLQSLMVVLLDQLARDWKLSKVPQTRPAEAPTAMSAASDDQPSPSPIMKVTQVAIRPSEASAKAARPALTPELLAACGARYSRNSGGLESILSQIDPAHLEKSVDSIFRMVDYGHQSIADMVPVAMFIDGVSLWLAYYLWTLSPTAGGQESSTRYLKMSPEGLVPPEELGIPSNHLRAWRELMARCYRAYQSSLSLWEELAGENPALMGIPASLLNDPSESARKKVARMKRNYAFDRARYFLPVGAATNLMMVMSARGWVGLCQHLLVHRRPEARHLGQFIRDELEICAPRLLKHARPSRPCNAPWPVNSRTWPAWPAAKALPGRTAHSPILRPRQSLSCP